MRNSCVPSVKQLNGKNSWVCCAQHLGSTVQEANALANISAQILSEQENQAAIKVSSAAIYVHQATANTDISESRKATYGLLTYVQSYVFAALEGQHAEHIPIRSLSSLSLHCSENTAVDVNKQPIRRLAALGYICVLLSLDANLIAALDTLMVAWVPCSDKI